MTSPDRTLSDLGSSAGSDNRGRTITLNLPFLTGELRVPQLRAARLPRVSSREVKDAAQGIGGLLPPPDQLLYYGGLGLMAALDVIDWPVALAIGAGTALARRREPARPLLPAGRPREPDRGAEAAQQMAPPRRRRPRAEAPEEPAAAARRRPGRPRKTAAAT